LPELGWGVMVDSTQTPQQGGKVVMSQTTLAVDMLNDAFSELRYEVLELISERDVVAARTVMHGVHTGPIRTLAPTGKRFAMSQSHWFRAVDGRLAEHWATRDDLGFLHQVGTAPGARVGAEATGATND
jgi:predicted ester cyclase